MRGVEVVPVFDIFEIVSIACWERSNVRSSLARHHLGPSLQLGGAWLSDFAMLLSNSLEALSIPGHGVDMGSVFLAKLELAHCACSTPL